MNKLRRRFHVEINAGGDTLPDVLRALMDIVHCIKDEAIYESVLGGVEVGYHYKLVEDPTMTNEKYREELNKLLAEKRNESRSIVQ